MEYLIRGWRARIIKGSAAFLMGLSLFLLGVIPVHAQNDPGVVVRYSVVTVEAEADLRELANRYHTTVEDILKQNSVSNLRSRMTLTIQENTIERKVISRSTETVWNWPVKGPKSSDYGWRGENFHHGLDIAIPSGSLIRAARAGRVIKTGWLGVYGLTVMVEHENGVQTLYAHNSKVLVEVGDRVVGGEEISLSGNTGKSTGPHLHFEIRFNGKTVDPEHYLPNTRLATM